MPWKKAEALDTALVAEETVLPCTPPKHPLYAHLAPIVSLPCEVLPLLALCRLGLRLCRLPAIRVECLPGLRKSEKVTGSSLKPPHNLPILKDRTPVVGFD